MKLNDDEEKKSEYDSIQKPRYLTKPPHPKVLEAGLDPLYQRYDEKREKLVRKRLTSEYRYLKEGEKPKNHFGGYNGHQGDIKLTPDTEKIQEYLMNNETYNENREVKHNKPINLQSQELHPKQLEMAKLASSTKVKFRFLLCGRNFGKTVLLKNLILFHCLNERNKTFFLITQTHHFTKIIMEELVSTLGGLVANQNKSELRLTLVNGTKLDGFSYQNYDNLRGFNHADGIFVDEAAKLPNIGQNTVLRQVCFTPKFVYLVSTPKGLNQFYELIQETEGNNIVLKGTTYDNPYVPLDEKKRLDLIKGSDIYRQEILAEFLENGGMVFKHTGHLLNTQKVTHSRNYFTAVDLAQAEDYTVITTMNKFKEIVEIERFNQIPYEEIVYRIVQHRNRQNSELMIEKNNIGGVIIEMTKKHVRNVDDFVTTNKTKQDIINQLRVDMESASIRNCSKDIQLTNLLIEELDSFEFKISASGNIIYGCQKGTHDDMVMSLALCNMMVHENNSIQRSKVYKL